MKPLLKPCSAGWASSAPPALTTLSPMSVMLAGQAPTEGIRDRVTGVIRYLGTLVPDRRTALPPEVEPLRKLAWLPAERDQLRWYSPAEVQTEARRYLFETQGRFLDVPREVRCNLPPTSCTGSALPRTLRQCKSSLTCYTCAEQGTDGKPGSVPRAELKTWTTRPSPRLAAQEMPANR